MAAPDAIANIFLANDQEIFRDKMPDWILGRVSLVIDTCLEFIENDQHFYFNLVNRQRTSFVTRDAASGQIALNPDTEFIFKRFKWPLRKKSKSLPIYLFLLEKIRDLLHSNSTMTKRDLYYQNVTLFGSQAVCDGAIEDLAVSLGVKRFELGLVASSKGLVIGPIRFIMLDDSIIDASNNVCLIPDRDQIQSIEVEACNVIVVEKDASFQAIVQSDFLDHNPRTILLTGKGFPDVATRSLLVQLSRMEMVTDTTNTPSQAQSLLLGSPSVQDSELIEVSQNQQQSQSLVAQSHQQEFERDFWDDNSDLDIKQSANASLSLSLLPPQGTSHSPAFDMDSEMEPTVPDFSLSPGQLQDSYEYLVPDEEEEEEPLQPAGPAKIKTFILADCDPDGFEIMMTYKFGSTALGFYSADLGCPDLQWMGVLPSHLYTSSKLSLPSPLVLIPLSVRDRKKLVKMLSRTLVSSSPSLKREFQQLLMNGYKAELQVMTIDQLISLVISPAFADS